MEKRARFLFIKSKSHTASPMLANARLPWRMLLARGVIGDIRRFSILCSVSLVKWIFILPSSASGLLAMIGTPGGDIFVDWFAQ